MDIIKIDNSNLKEKYHFLSDPLTFSDKAQANFCQPETCIEFLECLMETKNEFFKDSNKIESACYAFERTIKKNRELKAFKNYCKKIIKLKEQKAQERDF